MITAYLKPTTAKTTQNNAAAHAPALPPAALRTAFEVPAPSPSTLSPLLLSGDASLLLLLLLLSTNSTSLGDGVSGCSEGGKSTGAGFIKAAVGSRVAAGSGAPELGTGVAALVLRTMGTGRRAAVAVAAAAELAVGEGGEREGWDNHQGD